MKQNLDVRKEINQSSPSDQSSKALNNYEGQIVVYRPAKRFVSLTGLAYAFVGLEGRLKALLPRLVLSYFPGLRLVMARMLFYFLLSVC